MDLDGRHVVVTGGGNGIGEALCRRFAREGPRALVVADIDAGGAQRVAGEIGAVASAADLDVRDGAAVEALVERAEAENGPIDLFCSNAGIAVPGGPEAPDAEWQRIWDINVMAHVHAARAVLPGMLERGEGYLLNTASAAGLLSQIGSAPYSVTKAAAVSFGEWLSITYGDRGLRVSLLCPQAVRTAMTADTDAGGVAGVDGMMAPDQVAEATVEGIREERFLILPHPEVATYVRRKADDVERWLTGMRRLQARFSPDGMRQA